MKYCLDKPFKVEILYAEMHWIYSTYKCHDRVTSTTKNTGSGWFYGCLGSLVHTYYTSSAEKRTAHLASLEKDQHSKFKVHFLLNNMYWFYTNQKLYIKPWDGLTFSLLSSLRQFDFSKFLQLTASILEALAFIPIFWKTFIGIRVEQCQYLIL